MSEHEEETNMQGGEQTKSFASFLNMLEDGELHSDLSEKLRQICGDMENSAMENGGKAKAGLTINIEFLLDKGVFEIRSGYKIKMPEGKRQRTIAWATPGNNFSPNNPRQMNMFEKPRDASVIGRSDVKGVI